MKKPFAWYGGKHFMMKTLAGIIPEDGRIYCEPYCGSATVLFNRQRKCKEILNDLDERITNFYQVLKSDDYWKLMNMLENTPWALEEYYRAEVLLNSSSKVERAWAFLVLQGQTFYAIPVREARSGKWQRTNNKSSSCGMAANCAKWMKQIRMLKKFRDRLRYVQIRHGDAIECILEYDSSNTVFYIDPPYPSETRDKSSLNVYDHEASDNHLYHLRDTIRYASARIVLTTYWSEMWRPLLDDGWESINVPTFSFAGRKRTPRTEYVLINPKCAKGLQMKNVRKQFSLFSDLSL